MKRLVSNIIILLCLSALIYAQINLCSNSYTHQSAIHLTGTGKIVIRGDSINNLGGSNPCIWLINYDTVIIKRCRLLNSAAQAIKCDNCGVLIVDSCYMTSVSDGVHDNLGRGRFTITNNYISNVNGPFPLGNGVQINQVNAPGLIANNYIENLDGIAQHPQDLLSVYKSNGNIGDSIRVTGNYLRGGQIIHDSGGAAGIVLNDVGGSYQVARNNRMVNPGAVGIQIQGGHGSKVDHNFIYGDGHGLISFEGLQYGNYSGDTTYAVEMSYNLIYWRQPGGSPVFNRWVDKAIGSPSSTASGHAGGPTLPDPIGWATNTPVSTAGAVATSIVPTPMIICSTPPVPPIPPAPGSGGIWIKNKRVFIKG